MKIEYEEIKQARIASDLTQKELAEQTGVNLSIIKALETGRGTDKSNVAALCKALGLRMDDIYREDFRNTKVISLVNNKGGCGKTSVCGSLAYVFAEMGNKVLLVDTDAQRNLTSSYGLPKQKKHFGMAIEREESLLDYIVPTSYENIDFIVADVSMGTMDMMMFTKLHRENLVRQSIAPVIDAGIYDFVLMDTNPNLSLLNFNVVNASDYIVIPVQMASFDVEGIGTVIDFIRGIQKFNPNVRILGIVINKYDLRTRSITEAAEAELKTAYGDLILNTYLRTDVKIQNAQWENRPIFTRGASRLGREYRELSKEILKRIKQPAALW